MNKHIRTKKLLLKLLIEEIESGKPSGDYLIYYIRNNIIGYMTRQVEHKGKQLYNQRSIYNEYIFEELHKLDELLLNKNVRKKWAKDYLSRPRS